ncbi:MAG: hypothetical protein LUG45_03475 [Clostridiales bacterium]|nr:hypothetical protein [Clostridiales bacterium]
MQIVGLGNLVLGIMATAEELTERGVCPEEPDGDALLRFVWEVCRQEGLRASRVDEVEVRVGQALLTIFCFLLPPERECFRFEGLGEALDALSAAGSPKRCALLRHERSYVAVTASAGCGALLSEFGQPLDSRAAARAYAQGEVLAEGKQLALLLRRRKR